MKKAVMLLAVLAVLAGFAVQAQASRCEYHQWTPCHTRSMGDRVPAQKCEYYQWKWIPCRPERPAPVAAKPSRFVLRGVQFDTASARIKPESYTILNNNMDALKGTQQIRIVGHTDSRGNPASNMRLSEARAKSVKDYYVSKGISASRITTEGRGASNPIADNATEAGRAENRRIEIELK